MVTYGKTIERIYEIPKFEITERTFISIYKSPMNARGEGNLRAGSDAENIELFDLNRLSELAFDHNKIIENAKKDIKGGIKRVAI